MPSHSAVSPVFVGREDELTLLTQALARADAGEPQALLLGGEAGVGKTRLLEEFLTAADGACAVTAVGGCLELGADGLPFAPFATALRCLRRALGEAELTEAAAGREAELARLLPDLTPAPGSPGAARAEAYDEEDGRARLFELTAQLLERLAAGRTVVIALEDLHWADRSTRELLGYLFRSLQGSRLVLLATYRADDIHRRHPLRPFLAELDRLRTVRRVELPRLTRDEVGAQIAGIQGVPDADPEQARAIFERSEGNPFFVEELTANPSSCGISDSLRDLLLVRVEALPEQVQQVLRIAAQGGSTVEHALLAAVCGLPEAGLLDALRTAVGANVLLPTAEGDGYRFRHALLREAVGEDLLPGEAAALNRRYAQALEADPALVRSEQRATRLAHYWYQGRDAAKALPAVLAAAVEARRRHAFAEQHQLLERAIELWQEAPEEVRERLRPMDEAEGYPRAGCPDDAPAESLSFMDLLAETVVAARIGGDVERALALVRRALDLLDETADPLRSAWFWVMRSKCVEVLGRGDGWDEIARAQQLVRGLPPSAVHADVLAGAAAWGMMHRPGPEAMSTAVRAVELARVVGATVTELQARITLGILMAESGGLDAGIAEMTHAREQALEAGAFGVVGRADINIATELESMGRSSEAVAAAVRGAEGAKAHGRLDISGFALGNQAESLYAMGEWAEAARVTEESAAVARSAETRGFAALIRAHLRLGHGELDELESAAAAAREALGSHAHSTHAAVQLRHFALEVAAGRGDFEGARAELRAAVEAGFPPGTHRYAWPLLHAAAAHEAGIRGLPAAEEERAGVLELLRATARRLPHPAPVWKAYSELVRAEILRAEGRSSADAWEAVTSAFEEQERPFQLALARQRLAEVLLEDGARERGQGRERAHELLAAAHEVAARLGAVPLRTEIEQLVARARLPLGPERTAAQSPDSSPGTASAAPVGAADAFGLTQRERDVLDLVAAGRSNRQIAERLFISPKTASVHVSNILAKLGVGGRGEAAAMAHRLRLTDVEKRPAAG